MIREMAGSLPSMKELAGSLPSTEDLARYLQGRSAERDFLPGLALFGAGLLVGAGLALLLAPSSGEELRETLGRKMEGMMSERWPDEEQHEPAGNGTPA